MSKVTSKERNNRFDRIKISQERPARQTHGGNQCSTELFLEKGLMRIQSYVVVRDVFQVLASQLRLCGLSNDSRAYDSRLDEKSYTLLMIRFGMEPEIWVPTIVLKSSPPSSQESLLRHDWEPPRPSRLGPLADPGVSLPYRYTEANPLPPNSTLSRRSEVRQSHGGYHARVQQQLNRDRLYDSYIRNQSIEQRQYIAPPADSDEDAMFSGKSLLMLLAAGAFFWWRWRSK